MLNSHVVKLTSKYSYLCPYYGTVLNLHLRNFFLQWTVANMESHLWKYMKCQTCWSKNQKQGPEDEVLLWKLPLGMHGHYTQRHTGSMAICTRQACQNSNTDDCGGSYEALALAENLLTVNGCWGKRAIFSVLKIKTPSLHQNAHSYISQPLRKKTGV